MTLSSDTEAGKIYQSAKLIKTVAFSDKTLISNKKETCHLAIPPEAELFKQAVYSELRYFYLQYLHCYPRMLLNTVFGPKVCLSVGVSICLYNNSTTSL